MSQIDEAIDVIKDYIYALDEIGVWQGYTFKELSYSKWAAKELIAYIKSHKNQPPLLVMELFRDKMFDYARLNNKPDNLFTIAYNAVQDMIDNLIR